MVPRVPVIERFHCIPYSGTSLQYCMGTIAIGNEVIEGWTFLNGNAIRTNQVWSLDALRGVLLYLDILC